MCGERQEEQIGKDESDLIRAAQTGDRLAYDELVRRHQRSVYRWAYKVVRSHDLADEVAQEVFVRTYMALERIDPERPLGSWLCKTTVNVALNIVRKQRFRAQWTEDGRSEVSELQAPGPDIEFQHRRMIARVEHVIDALPPIYRTILLLRTTENMSYEEIAEALGISMGTVMSRLARARKKLRKELGPLLEDMHE